MILKREFSRKGQYQMLTKSRRSHILVLKNTFLVLFEKITFWLYTETFWHSRNQIIIRFMAHVEIPFFLYTYVDFSRGQRCYLCNRLKLVFFCIMYIYHSIAWHYNFFFHLLNFSKLYCRRRRSSSGFSGKGLFEYY